MKSMFKVLALLAATVVVGAGCFLLDASSNPVLWYALWMACLALFTLGEWLEWGISSHWKVVLAFLVGGIPVWVSLWLYAWGYISDDVLFWVAIAGLLIVSVLQ